MTLPPCLMHHKVRVAIETVEGETLDTMVVWLLRHSLGGNYSLRLLIQGISNSWLLLVLPLRKNLGTYYSIHHIVMLYVYSMTRCPISEVTSDRLLDILVTDMVSHSKLY